MPRPSQFLIAALALVLSGVAASAHPHVWVTAKSVIVYGADGRATGIRHDWTFDEAYSAFAVQGLDTGNDGKPLPEKLAELAKTNVESLAEFDYFTVVKANGQRVQYAAPVDFATSVDGPTLSLRFLLPFKNPAKADRSLLLDIYDPTFFVDFSLAPGADAVTLEGAPKGCALRVTRPKPVDEAEAKKLDDAFYAALSSAANFGAQYANRALVACP